MRETGMGEGVKCVRRDSGNWGISQIFEVCVRVYVHIVRSFDLFGKGNKVAGDGWKDFTLLTEAVKIREIVWSLWEGS